MQFKGKKCPSCGKHIPMLLICQYFFYGTAHSIRCAHCAALLGPVKEPIPFVVCYMAGLMSAVVPMVYFLVIERCDFLHALLYTSPIIVLTILIGSLLTLRRIQFRER